MRPMCRLCRLARRALPTQRASPCPHLSYPCRVPSDVLKLMLSLVAVDAVERHGDAVGLGATALMSSGSPA
jgi:hypothetical protein